MNGPKEHRIYAHIDKPLTLAGLTVPELGVAAAHLMTFLCLEEWVSRIIAAAAGVASVYGMKTFKKHAEGFSVVSWLHWHFGWRFSLPKIVPPPKIQKWRG